MLPSSLKPAAHLLVVLFSEEEKCKQAHGLSSAGCTSYGKHPPFSNGMPASTVNPDILPLQHCHIRYGSLCDRRGLLACGGVCLRVHWGTGFSGPEWLETLTYHASWCDRGPLKHRRVTGNWGSIPENRPATRPVRPRSAAGAQIAH